VAKPPIQTPRDIYLALRADAEAGDKRSQAMLAAVDAYLGDKGISVDALTLPAQGKTEVRSVGPVRLTVVSFAPWSISIRNYTDFSAPSDLAAYIALRTATVDSLGKAKANRQIRASVTPNALVNVDEFVKSLECDCDLREIVTDVFIGDLWAFSSVYPLEGKVEGSELAERLHADAVKVAGLHMPFVKGDLRLTVHQLTLSTSAGEAQRLSRLPNVLLVDPVDDLADLYAGQAAFVDVTGMPDAFYSHAKWALGVSLDATMATSPTKEE
jgi:hypothetical protein